MKRLLLLAPVIAISTGCGVTIDTGDSSDTSEPSSSETETVTEPEEEVPQTLYDYVKDWTCEQAGADAVSVSEETTADGGVVLLKVREPQIKKDNRSPDMTLPTGTNELLVMSCTGTGVWSDGDTTTRVLIRYTVDADGQPFTQYMAIE